MSPKHKPSVNWGGTVTDGILFTNSVAILLILTVPNLISHTNTPPNRLAYVAKGQEAARLRPATA